MKDKKERSVASSLKPVKKEKGPVKQKRGPKLPPVDLAHCGTCDQWSNDFDRDAPCHEQILVKWVKHAPDKHGRMVPKSCECYYCFHVRRKFFKGIPQS